MKPESVTIESYNTLPDPKVSVVTVNYYCLDEILKSYKSIEKHSTNINFEYIIVSNSPIEFKHKARLRNCSRLSQTIELESNKGFSFANNIGAKHADGEYIFFLNPDTRFYNNALQILLHTFKQYPRAGILGPQTLDREGNKAGSIKNHISYLTLFHEALPLLKWFTSEQFWDGHYRKYQTGYVDIVNGSALFIPKNLFFEIGGMNESFFLYWEENDLCLKIREQNYKVLYVNEAIVQHHGKITTKKNFIPLEIERHRSRKKFINQYRQELSVLNRLTGIFSFFWRTLFSLALFRISKVKQFGALLTWYLFHYK